MDLKHCWEENNLRHSYEGPKTKIVNNVYVPLLMNSNLYQRQAGYFRSSSLALASVGFIQFIKNARYRKRFCYKKDCRK